MITIKNSRRKVDYDKDVGIERVQGGTTASWKAREMAKVVLLPVVL
jgi:hypothetical protein